MIHRKQVLLVAAVAILAGGALPLLAQTIGPGNPAPKLPTGVFQATRYFDGSIDCAGSCYGHFCCIISPP